MSSVLLIGGSRSGKSAMAQRMAASHGGRVAVAVFGKRGVDPEFDQRIERHLVDRPAGWTTVDATSDPEWLASLAAYDVVLIDCVGTWLSFQAERTDYIDAERVVASGCARIAEMTKSCIFVSNEVGMSLTPLSEVGRAHADSLGRINQVLADRCSRSYLVAAGRAVPLHNYPTTPEWSFRD